MPCLSYLMGGSNQAAVPAGCCSGIQSLYTAASTTPDRQGVCSCLKSGAASLGNNIDTNKAATLLSKCGVPFPYKISANIDCSKIHYLMGGSNQAAVPAGCCSGIQSLYTAASTTPDRQGVCSCLKSGAASLGNNIDTNKAATLLSKCGVPFPYKISANIDCSKIQ
ncbi:Non-specific lipid-transfer protein [Capsicum chinense]|nr:Non-specific lipid-transfer protein [Capsicum chinense]